MNPFMNCPGPVRCVGLLLLGVGLMAVRAEEPLTPAEAVRVGQSLAEELRSLRPGASSTNTGVLRMRDAKGRRREVPVTVLTVVGSNDWQVSYQASLSNGASETLTARYGSGAPVYEVARSAPGASMAGAPKVIAPGGTAISFANSDFWVCDLGLEFLHWPAQRYVKDELSNGRPCHVLESMNPSTNGYAKVWSYIDQEFKGLLSAKGFDSRGFVIKDFSTGNFVRVKDHWFLKDIRIRDERSDTRTELLYTIPPE